MRFVVTFTYNSDYPLLQYYSFFDQILNYWYFPKLDNNNLCKVILKNYIMFLRYH